MDVSEVAALARELMDRHGLDRWSLRFDRARRRAGMTRFSDSTISLSGVLMPLFDEAGVRDTILHEIAHALVGPGHGHDAEWKAVARALGASDRARFANAPCPPAPWVGTCPNGHEIERFRKPGGARSCAACSNVYDPAFAIRWRRRAPIG